jgi:hypothetical protein
MEMENDMLQMIKRILTSQEEATAELKADIIAKIEAGHERFLAIPDEWKSYGKGTTTCQADTTSCPEEMDATRLEATLEATEAAVERQKLRENEINAKNIGSSEDRYAEQGLAARRRRGTKKRTQDSVGSRQKVSAARKGVICCTIPAMRKGNIRKGPSKNSTARGASRRKTHEKKQRLRSGVQQENKLPRFKTKTTSADEDDIREN